MSRTCFTFQPRTPVTLHRPRGQACWPLALNFPPFNWISSCLKLRCLKARPSLHTHTTTTLQKASFITERWLWKHADKSRSVETHTTTKTVGSGCQKACSHCSCCFVVEWNFKLGFVKVQSHSVLQLNVASEDYYFPPPLLLSGTCISPKWAQNIWVKTENRFENVKK